ncbi:hypothetical protein ZIOFF_028956 [Zingiber officinale]|uniref:PUM-HD domain-containing protein n=1 Tax=Zingiber officinale TaxID=94328 RepID=A0A8J5L3V6_ZINOF|nr:hypothetical protein ZIOFF_028956 [Zingiber officinale]
MVTLFLCVLASVRHGKPEERSVIISNLAGQIVKMSQQKYASNVIEKCLAYGTAEERQLLISEMLGSTDENEPLQGGKSIKASCKYGFRRLPPSQTQKVKGRHHNMLELQITTVKSIFRNVSELVELLNTDSDWQVGLGLVDADPILSEKLNTLLSGCVSISACSQAFSRKNVALSSSLLFRTLELLKRKVSCKGTKLEADCIEVDFCLRHSRGGRYSHPLLLMLQAMMKDQFGNYVVQKVLETCDDRNREHILSRIKVHLNPLKKYTYGKHIVARVEKLIATGERHIGGAVLSRRGN